MYRQDNLPTVTLADFARLFGTTTDDITESCKDIIDTVDLRYERLSGTDRDKIILNILKKTESVDLSTSGEKRKPEWEKGWAENLQDFINSGYDISKLVPKYFKKNVPVRLNREYVMPMDPDFVLNCTRVFRTWLFKKYLKDSGSIYEFGCGPATHKVFWQASTLTRNFMGLTGQNLLRKLSVFWQNILACG